MRPDESESARPATELTEWIVREIRAQGAVPFSRFMEWALYHPRLGYYTRGPSIGVRGDFVTSPEASGDFARLFAAHIEDTDALLGHPDRFDLVEFGPGNGTLMQALIAQVIAAAPDLAGRLRVWMVETSPALTARQRKRLSRTPPTVPIGWVTSVEEVPRGRSGAIIANEFVDAFPVHILVAAPDGSGRVLEEYVTVNDAGELAHETRPPGDARLIDFVARYGIKLNRGERIEVNLESRSWLEEVARVLDRGTLTVIDYGDTQPARYSAGRRSGTLLAYFNGAVTSELLARPGEQDLTALVDFTALEDEARAAGFVTVGATRQASFLVGLGLGTTIPFGGRSSILDEAIATRRGHQALVSPQGLGRFHVLVLGRGVSVEDARPALRGLRYEDAF